MKKVLWVVVAAVVLIIIYAISGGTSTPAGPIKIGVVGPMSGDTAAFGAQMKHVLDYRLAQINAAAGEKGQKFELVYEDGKCAGSESASAFQKLTDIDGVKIILGGLCSSETLAMSPLANEKKVLLLSPMSSNPKIEDEGPFTMSLSYSDKMTGEQLAKAVSGFKKVAMISEQNDYNVGVHDSFAAALKAYPTAVFVSDETFPKNASDFRGTLAKVKATSPDVLVLNPNPGTTATNLLKQLAEMKTWTGYKLYGQIAYIGDASRTAVGKFAEGMTIIDVPTINSADFKTISDAIVAQSGTLNDIGSYYVASTLDDLDLLTSEITKLGNDATKVQQDLSTGSFNGFVGPISFGGNNFFKFTTPGVYIVQDGKAVLQ